MKLSEIEPGDIRVESNAKVAIVAARFNSDIVNNLLAGATSTLQSHGVSEANIDIFKVPGAFELPLLAQHLAETNKYIAIITLGCVIRGDTPHFDYVAGECAHGIMQVGLTTGVPIIFGVLTTDTAEQAHARANLQGDNKGVDCALCALEMSTSINHILVDS